MKDLKADFEKFRKGNVRDFGKLDLETWWKLSHEDGAVYPSQGLLLTPYDGFGPVKTQMLSPELVSQTLKMRMFFLEMFNHPYRMKYLKQVSKSRFVAPKKVKSLINFDISLSVGDFGAKVVGSQRDRISRSERYAQGPFVKLGRQARTFFVGSASPDVWNSSLAISTMAASHCLSGVPRNGVLADIKRQADLSSEVFEQLDELSKLILSGRTDQKEILNIWKKNVMGVVEASPDSVMNRAEALYKKGIRSFRVYSPEPGTGPVKTVLKLRKEFGSEIEVFAGQVVDERQTRQVEDAGADGVFVGIGGGGRCITGVRSGSVIDWPELVWKLRGKIKIPIIIEGGASDHVAVSLLLGASGIGVSRIVSGGTIESPGGLLYCSDENGNLFKPYGGEASARTKFLDGKLLPFGIPSFVEGETTKAKISFIRHALPTLTYNLHQLIEDSILTLVFRGVKNIVDLQAINPSPLRQMTSSGEFQMNTH